MNKPISRDFLQHVTVNCLGMLLPKQPDFLDVDYHFLHLEAVDRFYYYCSTENFHHVFNLPIHSEFINISCCFITSSVLPTAVGRKYKWTNICFYQGRITQRA